MAEPSDPHPEPAPARADGWLRVERHEWPAVWLGFTYFFFVLASYYVIRPVRDQLSAAVGSIELPLFYSATFAATLALTPLFGALVARFRRRRFVPAVYLFCIAGTLAFVPLFRMQEEIGVRLLGTVFFVWGSVFNLFVVAVFWSFMADLFDAAQSRRLFPLIALGGPLGAIAGPLLTRDLVYHIGVSGLLTVSAALLGATLVCIAGLLRWSRQNPVSGDPRRDERIIGGGVMAGAAITFSSALLFRIAVLMLLGDSVGTVVYALLADYSHAHFHTAASRIDFAASIDLGTNLLQAALQILLTRELMVRLGPVWALVLDGAVKAAMLGGLMVFGAGWIAVVAVITRASAYGIFKPAADSLYTLVNAETRYKGKNFIDTVVWRFGDVVITSGLNALRGAGVVLAGLAGLSMLAAAASGFLGWRLGRAPELREDKPVPAR
ncbi:MAG: NTP/NDP exchange transporter [Rudaea sp.]